MEEYEETNSYENEMPQKRHQTKSVLFGSNTINQKIHDEFRLKAKRNESFKKAVHSTSSKGRGTLKEDLKRSLEDLHEGFKSVSRTNSINESINSRSNSLERRGSQASIGQRRRGSGSSGNGSVGRRESQTVILSKQKSRSQERLKQRQAPMNKNLKNDLSAGFGILTTGLGPRRASRERINQKTAKKARSQDSLDNLTVKQQPSRERQPHKMSRSKENLNKSKSRENLDQKSNQSFAGEFVDFYMGKRKA